MVAGIGLWRSRFSLLESRSLCSVCGWVRAREASDRLQRGEAIDGPPEVLNLISHVLIFLSHRVHPDLAVRARAKFTLAISRVLLASLGVDGYTMRYGGRAGFRSPAHARAVRCGSARFRRLPHFAVAGRRAQLRCACAVLRCCRRCSSPRWCTAAGMQGGTAFASGYFYLHHSIARTNLLYRGNLLRISMADLCVFESRYVRRRGVDGFVGVRLGCIFRRTCGMIQPCEPV